MTAPISALQRVHQAAQASAHRAIQEAALRGGDGIAVPFTQPDGAPSFAETLKNAIGEVSAAQEQSAALTDAFVRGENVELHQVMAAAEEASISLELLVEVRNKFTEAYRTVINMQG